MYIIDKAYLIKNNTFFPPSESIYTFRNFILESKHTRILIPDFNKSRSVFYGNLLKKIFFKIKYLKVMKIQLLTALLTTKKYLKLFKSTGLLQKNQVFFLKKYVLKNLSKLQYYKSTRASHYLRTKNLKSKNVFKKSKTFSYFSTIPRFEAPSFIYIHKQK
jgi:hypothetical protein